MQTRIIRNKVATFDYTVTDEQGQLIDTSLEYGPLSYIHGKGTLVPGLEAAMDGKSSGDSFSIKLTPSQGYGERDDSLIHVFTRKELVKLGNLKVGMQLQAQDTKGERTLVVTEIDGDTITLDENHPLAGKTIKFDINVLSVRDATQDELYSEQAFSIACHADCQNGCQDHHSEIHGCGHHGTDHSCGCDHPHH